MFYIVSFCNISLLCLWTRGRRRDDATWSGHFDVGSFAEKCCTVSALKRGVKLTTSSTIDATILHFKRGAWRFRVEVLCVRYYLFL